jgi:hypothetical protein
MASTAVLKNRVDVLWKTAVGQFEDVKARVRRSGGRWEADWMRLRREQAKLLTLLGEQTYKLANQGKVPLPTIVRRTVDRLNVVIDRMVQHEMSSKHTSPAAAEMRTSVGEGHRSEGGVEGVSTRKKSSRARKSTKTSTGSKKSRTTN